MNRIFGVGNRIYTIIGLLAGLAVGLSQYLDLVPAEWRTSKAYFVALGVIAAGAWWKKNVDPAPLVVPPVDPPSPPPAAAA